MTAGREMRPRVHVAVAVVADAAGRVLVARRPANTHQGGLWEFPGGKLEPGESTHDALVRELAEETGLRVEASEPLIRIPFDYPDKRVLLDVRRVTAFRGWPHGREGQPLRWVPAAELPALEFPAANRPILAAASLPSAYAISPDTDDPEDRDWWAGLDRVLGSGGRLVQWRVPSLPPAARAAHARRAVARVQAAGGRCLVNGDPAAAAAAGADGVHLSGAALAGLERRPDLPLVGASCHDPEELVRAAALELDFAVLGPVQPTASHPGRTPLGWERFAAWVAEVPLPVYALGGVGPADLPAARAARAQGVAGIRAFWAA